jgi:putative endonuclease
VRTKDVLGRHGELLAARHLESSGIRVLDRNWRCSAGEIDIVGEDDGTLVICEVKTRRGFGFGFPAEAVTTAKAQRLRTLALRWLQENRREWPDRRGFPDLRFDVVSVVLPPDGPAVLEHLRGAF